MTAAITDEGSWVIELRYKPPGQHGVFARRWTLASWADSSPKDLVFADVGEQVRRALDFVVN